jgi:hypothetical protein
MKELEKKFLLDILNMFIRHNFLSKDRAEQLKNKFRLIELQEKDNLTDEGKEELVELKRKFGWDDELSD